MGSLNNKIAVITGGTCGLGLAIAQAYAREGAAVVIASRTIRSVEQAVQLLKQQGAQVDGRAYHVSDRAQVQALADRAPNRSKHCRSELCHRLCPQRSMTSL